MCMGATPKKWASVWCGKEVVEQSVKQRERDRRALVRPMLDVWAVGSTARNICMWDGHCDMLRRTYRCRRDSGQGVRE